MNLYMSYIYRVRLLYGPHGTVARVFHERCLPLAGGWLGSDVEYTQVPLRRDMEYDEWAGGGEGFVIVAEALDAYGWVRFRYL